MVVKLSQGNPCINAFSFLMSHTALCWAYTQTGSRCDLTVPLFIEACHQMYRTPENTDWFWGVSTKAQKIFPLSESIPSINPEGTMY